MKNMHFPHKYNRRRFGVSGTVGIVAAFIILLLALFQPVFLTKMFLAVARPLHLVRQDTAAGAGAVVDGFRSKEDVLVENKKLSEELKKAKIKAELFDELRQKTYASNAGTTTSVVARVLSSPPFTPYDTLILDHGSEDGLSAKDRVSFDDTVALGVIDTVSDRSSRVRLYSSPGSEQSVRVGERDFLVTARGEGGGIFQMLVLKEEGVARGEGVFLPDGRLLARVDAVLPNESDAFALVYAVVPFNLFELREVVVDPSL